MIYSIIVVYNKDISESQTYKFIKNYNDIQIVVCDNSTIDNNNEAIVLKDGNVYLSMHGNKGLPKAYNRAIDYLDSINTKDNYLMFLDDDTSLNEQYIKSVFHSIQSKKDIYVPIVKSEKMIMSPTINKKGYIKAIDSLDDLEHHKISAINSGMVIKQSIFAHFRYDEGLFLDYVDHAFFYEMNKQQKSIEVMKVEIYQNFSAEVFNKSAEKQRYKIFKKDVSYYFENIVKKKRLSLYVLLKRKVRLALRYKDIRILNW